MQVQEKKNSWKLSQWPFHFGSMITSDLSKQALQMFSVYKHSAEIFKMETTNRMFTGNIDMDRS